MSDVIALSLHRTGCLCLCMTLVLRWYDAISNLWKHQIRSITVQIGGEVILKFCTVNQLFNFWSGSIFIFISFGTHGAKLNE